MLSPGSSMASSEVCDQLCRGKLFLSKKRWISICILVATLGFVAILCQQRINGSGQFESAAWQSERGDYDDDNSRLYMISDLKLNHLKVGMSQRSVEQLLGEPDSTREASSVYSLGVSPYGIDSEFFVIKYDAGGNFVTTQWGRDLPEFIFWSKSIWATLGAVRQQKSAGTAGVVIQEAASSFRTSKRLEFKMP